MLTKILREVKHPFLLFEYVVKLMISSSYIHLLVIRIPDIQIALFVGSLSIGTAKISFFRRRFLPRFKEYSCLPILFHLFYSNRSSYSLRPIRLVYSIVYGID